jgi:2-keto-3-deoxy-L-rhamnonate aldolase RhmA
MTLAVPSTRGSSLRQCHADGRVAIGLAACVMRSVEIVTVARSCGYDCLVVDTEHGPIGIADVATLALASYEAGLTCLVRVTGPASPDLSRVLDLGAEGVIIPHVDSASEARAIVDRCRFAPNGRRSLPSPLARLDFRVPPAAEMMARIERQTLLVPMIESAAGLTAAEAIAAVPGIDALMVGANDLAADIGHVGDLAHPQVLAAFTRIARAAQAHGKWFAVIGVGEALLASHAAALGARLIVATNDINLLIDRGLEVAVRTRAIAAAPEARA